MDPIRINTPGRPGRPKRRPLPTARPVAADDVQTVVIPGCGHHPPEEAPEEMLAALRAFLAPYRDKQAAAPPGPQATPA